MATAGTIAIHLIARTEAFAKGMDASTRRIRALEKATKHTMAVVRRMGMIAAGVAVGGMTMLVRKSMQNIDTIAKLSDRLDVSTEFLTAFGHQAELSGLSASQFNKSIEMFIRRLGELKQGTGEARYGLEALGLTTEELLEMSSEDAFLTVARGIKEMRSQAERAATAYRFFGRSGSQMLNLIQGDLDGVIDRAAELGILFDREMAARVEAANDAITRLKESFVGVANTIAIAVAPMVEALADRISVTVSGATGLEAMEQTMRKIAVSATYLSDAWLVLKGIVEGIYSIWIRMLALVSAVVSTVSSKLGFSDAADIIDAYGQGLWEAGGELWSDNAMRNIGKARAEIIKFFDDIEQRRDDYEPPKFDPIPDVIDPDDIAGGSSARALGDAAAQEVRSAVVSVRGLSIGGMPDKQDQTNRLLSSIDREMKTLTGLLAMN